MDASCKIQGSIHVLCLVHKSMCPGNWVHITMSGFLRSIFSDNDLNKLELCLQRKYGLIYIPKKAKN